jgi:hypothetical protein
MIFPAVDAIRLEMSASGISADLGNIGEMISGADGNHGATADIIISLINIEEVRLSRDPIHYVKKDPGLLFKNPAVHLNLTLLFTAVKHDAGYGMSLQHIQQVIEFFQKKSYFDRNNTPALHQSIEKLVLEMVSFNIEQLHQLWSMLGGRYHPSIAYRMNMVTIDSVSDKGGELVKEIEANYMLK